MQPPGGKRTYEEIVVEILDRLRAGGVITDVNPGSVARTLVEAFAMELALAYARLASIYDASFIDTATNEALDHLVALLGVDRLAGRQATGDAIFGRDLRIRDRIEIPEGTELLVIKKGSDRKVTYRTLTKGRLEVGQQSVTLPIAVNIPAEDVATESEYTLSAADLGQAEVQQVANLAGIGAVQIVRPTAVRDHRESDDELRRRAKLLVASAGGGTYKAMERAVLDTGLVRSVTFRDKTVAPDEFQPGELEVAVDADLDAADIQQTIQDAINSSKGPGIFVKLRGMQAKTLWTWVTVQLVASLTREKRAVLRRQVEQTVQRAFLDLKSGDKLLWNPLQAKLLGLDGVLDLTRVRVAWDGLDTPTAPGREIPDTDLGPLDRLAPPKSGPPAIVKFEGEALVQVQVRIGATVAAAVQAKVAANVADLLAVVNDGESEPDRCLALVQVRAAVAAADPLLAYVSVTVHTQDEAQVEQSLRTADDYYILKQGYLLYLDRAGLRWGGGSA